MSEHDDLNDLQDIDRQIEECKSKLEMLNAKKRKLKHPHSLTISVEEAAKMLGIGRNSAYHAAKNGQIPTIKVGGRVLVPITAIQKLLGVK